MRRALRVTASAPTNGQHRGHDLSGASAIVNCGRGRCRDVRILELPRGLLQIVLTALGWRASFACALLHICFDHRSSSGRPGTGLISCRKASRALPATRGPFATRWLRRITPAGESASPPTRRRLLGRERECRRLCGSKPLADLAVVPLRNTHALSAANSCARPIALQRGEFPSWRP